MIEKTEILSYLKENKATLFSKFHLSKIGIFGSFARGEQNPDSDIDLIVEFQVGVQDLFLLKQELKAVMEKQFHKEVDICREKYIKPYFKERILKDAIFV